jgi:hypothetical protein
MIFPLSHLRLLSGNKDFAGSPRKQKNQAYQSLVFFMVSILQFIYKSKHAYSGMRLFNIFLIHY